MKKISLTRGYTTLVDDADYEKVNGYKWYAHTSPGSRNIYAATSVKGKRTYLHRLLVGVLGLDVDHINGDGLDNRRINLRSCEHRENSFNSRKALGKSSIFKRVSWAKKRHAWVVHITLPNRKTAFVGQFKNEIHAAVAADLWAKDLHGEFASTNFTVVSSK